MAAGSGAASAHGARSSSAVLEASLDRRFQGVSNTMESIQGLSTWCIENKKHHGLIVRYWMKWLKKCKSLAAEFGSKLTETHFWVHHYRLAKIGSISYSVE